MKSMFVDDFQIHSNTQDVDYFLETPIQGMGFPSVSNANRANSGEHGTFVSNAFYRERRIILTGVIFGETSTEYEQNRRLLEKNFRLTKDSDGLIEAKQLKFTTLDDLALQVDFYVDNFMSDVNQLTHGRYQADLLVPDFGLESQTLQIVNFDVPSGGGAVYPVIYPVIYGASVGGNFNVTNNGSSESFPIILLNGPLTEPFVQNLTTGETISLDTNIGGSSQIIIDMKAKTIIQDGSTNKLSTLDPGSSFWSLAPGVNNINFDTESTGDTGDMEFQFRDTYIGV